MDKMKDNLFGLGVFLVVVVLGGAGYSLVYSPKADLDRQSKALSTANKALKGFISEEVLPTEEYVRKITAAQEEMEDIFDEAVDVFQGRCEAFHLFFSDQAQVPTVSEFSGQYQDSSTSLRTKYWEKFPRKAVEGKEGEPEKEEDPEKRAPIIEMVKDTDIEGPESEAKMRQAMKQYWISEAVFSSCEQLEIGGLQSIDFPVEKERSASRRSSKKSEPKAPTSKVVYAKVEATVLLHMKYSKLKEFFGALYKNPRVPFLDPKSVEFGKIEDSVKDFSKFVRQQTFQSRALADAAEAAGELTVQDPLVKVRLDLVALDWKGVERVNDDSDGNEDEDE